MAFVLVNMRMQLARSQLSSKDRIEHRNRMLCPYNDNINPEAFSKFDVMSAIANLFPTVLLVF